MKIMKIIGRKSEIGQIRKLYDSGESEFVVVYGRRRVGKTFLVNQFFDNKFLFKVTGLAAVSYTHLTLPTIGG